MWKKIWRDEQADSLFWLWGFKEEFKAALAEVPPPNIPKWFSWVNFDK